MLKRLRLYQSAILLLLLSGGTLLAQSPAAALYKEKCQMCHAADGLGNTPAGKALKAHSFTAPEVLKESDSDLLAVIKNGKNKMPAFSGKLTDPQLSDLIAYIHELQKK
jgi:mono/diheme cytochrome c family protein